MFGVPFEALSASTIAAVAYVLEGLSDSTGTVMQAQPSLHQLLLPFLHYHLVQQKPMGHFNTLRVELLVIV
jgi:recombinational DNA repair protein (RecF pathway)